MILITIVIIFVYVIGVRRPTIRADRDDNGDRFFLSCNCNGSKSISVTIHQVLNVQYVVRYRHYYVQMMSLFLFSKLTS